MNKKQGKGKKNVFGLVSKIGTLLKKGGNNPNNPENAETSATSGSGEKDKDTPKKNFNIHISEDNLEVFTIGDEEEEEEEEEEKEENDKKDKNKKDKNENDIKENNIIENDVKEINNNKEDKLNIENKNNQEISNEKEENNNKINENIKDIENENNINNNINNIYKDEDNNLNKNTIIQINEENKENIQSNIEEENESSDNKEVKDENEKRKKIINDNFDTCHLFLRKGNDFNSNEINCFPIIRNKKKKNVFQKIGFFKKPKYDLVNYKIFFDECFIYLSRDIILDKKNTSKRRINNVLKVKNIINYTTSKEENNKYRIIIEIINKNGNLKNKEFFIEENYFGAFNEEINNSLKLYGGLYLKKNKCK